MKTTLTVVVDNIAAKGLKGEWGLSILAEHNGKQILVDTGASDLFATNLEKLGFDIRNIDFGVLSHAHYDHANGIPKFFQENEKAVFYVQDTTDANCYAKKFLFRKYIGIPKQLLADNPERIQWISGDMTLYEGAYIVPHKTPGLEQVGKREMMYRRINRKWKPDDFSHEQSLVLDTEKGLVIINCCSHGGAANIIREVMASFPNQKIYGIIGGFHLFNKSEAEILALAKEIRETGVEYVCTGHCTKERAYKVLQQELGERMHLLHCGMVMEF